MITTDDIAELFNAMRTSYGGQWKHGQTAVKVWRNALSTYPMERIHWAANEALKSYVDHPPTLPQFLALLRPKTPPPNTYLPAPQVSRVHAVANKALASVLTAMGAVDRATLKNLIELKNALADEFPGEYPTKEFVADLHRQLEALAAPHDQEAKSRETLEARRAFCRRWGFPDPVLQ